MSDRVREAFEALIEEMEEPPTWQEVRVPEARPRAARRRLRSVWVAAAAFVAILSFGVFGLVLTDNQEPVSVTVPYVRLDWSLQLDMRCEGMEIVDNGGFETAMVEIWGPTADNMVRVDATAPNGAVETMVVEMNDAGRAIQVWASYETESESVFRVSECAIVRALTSESFSMADPPFHPRAGVFPQEFVGFPDRRPDGTPIDLAEELSAHADSQRQDTWRGVRVTVYVDSSEFSDELGVNDRTRELWVDLENRRYERYAVDYDTETLGHFMLTIETLERSDATMERDFFSTDNLFHTRDLSGLEDADAPPVNTTLADRPSG